MKRFALSVVLLGACGDDVESSAGGSTGSETSTTNAPGTSAASSSTGGRSFDTTSTSVDASTSSTDASSSSEGSESTAAAESSSSSGIPEDAIVIQFVGNSYTAGNGVGPMVASIAGDAGIAVDARVIAPGGQTMEGHWSTPATQDAIAADDVDFVVLQGQSVEPWLGPASFLEHAGLLGNHACDAGAAVFMFETWARAAGHEVYDIDPEVPDPDALQAVLRDAYTAAAAESCADVAPAGDAWQRVWTAHPETGLYAADGSHATLAGSYLASCVFAEALLSVDVRGGWAPEALDGGDASTLQEAAHCTVAGDCD